MERAHSGAADIVVLTALPVEYEAVRRHLTHPAEHVDGAGTRYLVGRPLAGLGIVALAQLGPGNLTAAALSGRAIEEFTPSALLLVGVAGGLTDDVRIGDVVVATQVHAYHGGREDDSGFQPRPRGWPLSHTLEQVAREVADARVSARSAGGTAAPAVHFKPVVSGEVVLDSRKSAVAELVADHYGDAVAIDMESAGVAEAAHRRGYPNAITIRAISDATDGFKRSADVAGSQRAAAEHAAAFAMDLAARVIGGPAVESTMDTAAPYRGLAPFRERDADLFFGRAELADELADLVSRSRFAVVAGRSGSGKSSLVHAGLVPRLRRRGWAVATVRPLPDVPAATALAGALLPLLTPDLDPVTALRERATIAEVITAGRLPELVADVLGGTGADGVLVCVDQYEEVVARGEPAARELAAVLLELSSVSARAHVVVTMRTETLDVAVNQLGLGEATRHSVFLVNPMRQAQLRSAIEQPVARTGVRFEPGLVERILESAQDAPAALALVQFALTRLWEERRNGLLTHAAFDGVGGVGGALAGYAEQVWATQLDDTDRAAARRLFVQLVRPDGDSDDAVVRRTARARELGPDLESLARRLAATRLVVTGTGDAGESTYDLAHSALATHWQRLRDWLRQERDFRSWQEDLRDSIRRDEQVRGPRLAVAVRWLAEHPDGITVAEREFVTASRRRQRRYTAAWRGVAAVVVLLMIASVTFAVRLQQRTDDLAEQVRHNAALALLAEAADRVGSHPDTAVLLAVAAYRADPSPEVRAHLAGEYLRFRSTSRLLGSDVGVVDDVALSADGRVLAALGPGGTMVWRLDQPAAEPRLHRWRPRTIALNHDGSLLAGYFAGRIEVLGADGSTTTLGERERLATTADSIRFDATGRRLLTVVPDEGLQVWDIERKSRVPVPDGILGTTEVVTGSRTYQGEVWFGPDQRTVVVADDTELAVWDLPSGTATHLSSVDGATPPVSVSADGRTALACVDDAVVRWNLVTLRERDRRPLGERSCPLDADTPIDRTGQVISTADAAEGDDEHPRDRVSLADLGVDVPAYVAVPDALSASPAERRIATVETKETREPGTRLVGAVSTAIAVVDVDSGEFRPINQLLGADSSMRAPVFSQDLTMAATVSTAPEPVLRLWDTGTGKQLARTRHPDGSRPVGFVGDDAQLVAVDTGPDSLFVFDVPSLDVRELVLPTDPGVDPADAADSLTFSGVCVTDAPTPGRPAVLHAGLISRFDADSGSWVGDPVRPWRDEDELWRLAHTSACASRPDHDQLAFPVAGKVEIWSMDGALVSTLPTRSTSEINDIGFSQDGRLLAVLTEEGTVEVWDVEREEPAGQPRRVLPPSASGSIVDFLDANRIVVRNDDEAWLWDLDSDTGILRVDFLAGSRTQVATDGDRALLWSDSGLVTLSLDPREWVDHLCQVVGRDLTEAERATLPPGSPTGPVCPG